MRQDDAVWSEARRALWDRDFDKFRLLIRNGLSIDAQDEYGQTLLHVVIDSEADGALQSERPMTCDLTRFLITEGANPLVRNHLGETPLDWARDYGHDEAVAIMNQASDAPGSDE